MKRSLMIGPLVLLLAVSLVRAQPPVENCCACVANTERAAQPAGRAPLNPALFCALLASPAEVEAFGAKCDALDGDGVCLAPVMNTNQDCRATLAAEEFIACPSPTPAPVAGAPLLAALAGALVAIGALGACRRQRGVRA